MNEWLVVVDMPYYPTVHPCKSEADARKVYDSFKAHQADDEQVVYMVKVVAQDREETPHPEYEHEGEHCSACYWALNPQVADA